MLNSLISFIRMLVYMVNQLQRVRLTFGQMKVQHYNLDAHFDWAFHLVKMVIHFFSRIPETRFLDVFFTTPFDNALKPGQHSHIIFTPYESIFLPDLCSHQRSWQYYAESVSSKNKNTFLAVSARNWSRFRASDTNSTNVINMGLRCPLGAHGDYFLQTNGEKPYSRGINGIRYLN